MGKQKFCLPQLQPSPASRRRRKSQTPPFTARTLVIRMAASHGRGFVSLLVTARTLVIRMAASHGRGFVARSVDWAT